MRKFLWGAAILALTGCAEATEPEFTPDVAMVPAAVEMTLRMGQEGVVAGSAVKVQFLGVPEDSRCPIDAICVWQGNAVVEVGIRAGMGPTVPLQINTDLEPRHADWNGVRLTVLELQPAPRAAAPTRQEDYSARIRVEPIR